MANQQSESEVKRLREQVELAEEIIRAVEDDALPPAALPAWERYRKQYPREKA
jgi:hypothetical protein